jgi:tRNA threonylcarbamoyladenosine biosynthesis protein TsaB
MYILIIRTDNPEAEIGIYRNNDSLTHYSWHAHRELAETIHVVLKQQLDQVKVTLNDLNGIIFFKGPGSFTGLRIGASVANTLADSLHIPIVGTTGSTWISEGIKRLRGGDNMTYVMPAYGSEPHITPPRK